MLVGGKLQHHHPLVVLLQGTVKCSTKRVSHVKVDPHIQRLHINMGKFRGYEQLTYAELCMRLEQIGVTAFEFAHCLRASASHPLSKWLVMLHFAVVFSWGMWVFWGARQVYLLQGISGMYITNKHLHPIHHQRNWWILSHFFYCSVWRIFAQIEQ